MLVFFGAPGVGKGTQAQIISSRLHIPHISTGDILRNAISRKTELGIRAKDFMDKGELVPDEIIVGMVEDVLKNDKCKKGFILDGFPRTLSQAKILQPIIEELFDDKLTIIILETADEVIINRLAQRRTCSTCNAIINLNFLKDASKCPKCGSVNSFYKRKDDEEDVIKNRLDIFHKTTEPVLEFYQGKANLHRIDGTNNVEKITIEICKVIGC